MELEQSHLLGKVTNKNGDFYLEAPNYDLLQSNLITQKKIFEEGHQYCLWSIIRNSKDTIPIVFIIIIEF